MGERDKLEHRMARAQKKGMGRKFSSLLGQARLDEAQAIALSDEVACLLKWLREDILPPRGPDYATRLALLDWVTEELLARERQCMHRIAPVRKLLANHRQELLAYVERLDKHLSELGGKHQQSFADVLLSASADRSGVSGVVAVLFEPSSLRAKRGGLACGEESS